MGTEEDAAVADRLKDFLYDYEIEDFDKFNLHLSIGRIRCLGWARGSERNSSFKRNVDIIKIQSLLDKRKRTIFATMAWYSHANSILFLP